MRWMGEYPTYTCAAGRPLERDAVNAFNVSSNMARAVRRLTAPMRIARPLRSGRGDQYN